jgi:hypothetical protein
LTLLHFIPLLEIKKDLGLRRAKAQQTSCSKNSGELIMVSAWIPGGMASASDLSHMIMEVALFSPSSPETRNRWGRGASRPSFPVLNRARYTLATSAANKMSEIKSKRPYMADKRPFLTIIYPSHIMVQALKAGVTAMAPVTMRWAKHLDEDIRRETCGEKPLPEFAVADEMWKELPKLYDLFRRHMCTSLYALSIEWAVSTYGDIRTVDRLTKDISKSLKRKWGRNEATMQGVAVRIFSTALWSSFLPNLSQLLSDITWDGIFWLSTPKKGKRRAVRWAKVLSYVGRKALLHGAVCVGTSASVAAFSPLPPWAGSILNVWTEVTILAGATYFLGLERIEADV